MRITFPEDIELDEEYFKEKYSIDLNLYNYDLDGNTLEVYSNVWTWFNDRNTSEDFYLEELLGTEMPDEPLNDFAFFQENKSVLVEFDVFTP